MLSDKVIDPFLSVFLFTYFLHNKNELAGYCFWIIMSTSVPLCVLFLYSGSGAAQLLLYSITSFINSVYIGKPGS